jgi:hypothetical protein
MLLGAPRDGHAELLACCAVRVKLAPSRRSNVMAVDTDDEGDILPENPIGFPSLRLTYPKVSESGHWALLKKKVKKLMA